MRAPSSSMQAEQQSTFAEQLRHFRMRAGLSQAALAERANLSPAAVATLERRQRTAPYPRTLDALAQALNLSAIERAALIAAAHLETTLRQASTARPEVSQLPVWPTSFFGREIEVDTVQALLDPSRSAERLLTLMGPGGVGKTRLAVVAARTLANRFKDGVVFVDLAPLADARLVPATIARALGLREGGGRGAQDVLLDRLREQQVLLVLDNFEHLLGARALVTGLVQRCPRIALLVTSRTLLGVQGERRFAVAPLATPPVLPDRIADLDVNAWPAVQLFVARAQVLVPDFALTDANVAAVASICRRLDGIPLALELAAARVPLLPPEALLGRLERRLPLLTTGPQDLPQRQQTLRTTLAWSYDLLDSAVQVLFRRLAVFVGGWTLEAAETICTDAELAADDVLDRLQVLVESSLLRWLGETRGVSRFGMLETVREYANEQLVISGEVERVRASHADFYLTLAWPAHATAQADWPSAWARSPELVHQALDRLEGDFDNLSAALDWFVANGRLAQGLQLAVTLNSLWSRLGQYAAGRRSLETWLDLADTTAPAGSFRAERAIALSEAGTFASYQGDNEQARTWHRRSVELLREVDYPANLAIALANLGLAEWVAGDPEQANALLQEALERSRAANLPHTVAVSLRDLGLVARSRGEYVCAEAWFRQAAAQPLPTGWYRGYSLARSLSCLGRVAFLQHDLSGARTLLQQAFEVIRASRVTGQALADCLDWQAALEASEGDPARAVRLFGAADKHWRTSGAHRYSPDEGAYELDLAGVRAAMHEQEFGLAWTAGAAMQPEEAISFALRELGTN